MQSFTAAISLRPNIAYGRANELTPGGKYWDDLVNDKTARLPLEYFLFPYLVYIYAKSELNYKTGAKDFKKNASFLFLSTYYLLLVKVLSFGLNKTHNTPEEIEIVVYRKVFQAESTNKQILDIADRILEDYFNDSAIEEAVDNDLRGFLQNKVHQPI